MLSSVCTAMAGFFDGHSNKDTIIRANNTHDSQEIALRLTVDSSS